jgi:hypothetical protein
VLLDEEFLRAKWPVWELGVMMAALPDYGQPQPDSPGQARRTVLPVVLMDWEAVTATYVKHWEAEVTEAACSEGLPPATLADLKRLLEHEGIRQDQVQSAETQPSLASLPWLGCAALIRRDHVFCCIL